MAQVRLSYLRAGILGLFLWCAPFTPAYAGCTFDDVGDAFSSAVDGMQDLMSRPACLPLLSRPDFWFVSVAFTAGTASSNEIRGFCNELQNFDKNVGDAQQQGKELYDKLPKEVQGALADAFGGLTEVLKDFIPVIAYGSCACSAANSTGAAQLVDVGGACTKDAICWLQEALGGSSCDSDPYIFQMFDCTKGAVVSDPGAFTCDGNGFCTLGIAAGCFCPKPMSLGITFSIEHPPPENCRRDLQGYCLVCSCPYPSKAPAANALGVCLCPDGSPLQANGTCAPPCPGSCPADQILKSAIRQANGECVSQCICPAGQTMQDGVCQFPACADGQTRIPGGKCCAKTQVSACGQCCGPRQIPDEVSGSCMEDFREKKEPNRLPKPAMTPSRALFSPRSR